MASRLFDSLLTAIHSQVCCSAMHSLHWIGGDSLPSRSFVVLVELLFYLQPSQCPRPKLTRAAWAASTSFDPWSMDTVEAFRRSDASLDLLTSLGNPFEAVSEQERQQQQTLLSAAQSFADADVDTEPPSPPSDPESPTKDEVVDDDGDGWNDPDFLEREAEAARACGIPWQKRGPPPPWMGGPSVWRGQPCRQNGKWMKRGGKNKEYWTEHYRRINSERRSSGSAGETSGKGSGKAAGKNSGKGSSGAARQNSGKGSGGAAGASSGKGSSGAAGKNFGKVNKGSGKKGGGKASDEDDEKGRGRGSSSGLRR